MIPTSEFRRGLRIELEREPYIIVEFQHVKPGKGGAFVRTKLKSLLSGYVIDRTFRSGEKVERPDLEQKKLQFLYREDDLYHFMDMKTYEQLTLNADQVADRANFLADNLEVGALFYRGRAIGIDVPLFVELEVIVAEPGLRGDTASASTKPATLSTGVVVQVPLFISVGDKLKIDTRTGSYIERVK
ncbi:MAG: elongation factor P [Thermodesulfobacteriota bacterium]